MATLNESDAVVICERDSSAVATMPTSPCPAGDLPEAEAIRRAQSGDAGAFERLYRLHSRHVYALCLRMIGNTKDAEDLTQEAFLQLFRKIHTFRGESAFSTWLHRLSVNVVLMRLRKKTPIEVPLDDDDEEESRLPLREIGAPDLTLNGSVDRVNLERAIAQLAPGYRQAFVLHDIQGYEHKEIAAVLGCTIGNSKSQLHKARMRLRKLLRRACRGNARQKNSPRLAGWARFVSDRSVSDLGRSPIQGATKRREFCWSAVAAANK